MTNPLATALTSVPQLAKKSIPRWIPFLYDLGEFGRRIVLLGTEIFLHGSKIFKEGDSVEIIECKPISKKKTWEVIDR